MRPIKKYLILTLLLGLGGNFLTVQAQTDLQISKAFDRYGERKGVVMVELTDEMLNGYDFSLFKSLTIKEIPSAADFIRK